MPSLPSKACFTPGCRNTTDKGPRCAACSPRHHVSATKRGYDSAHIRLRLQAFIRDEWRCVDCGWRPQIVVDCEEYGIDEPPVPVILDWLRVEFKRGNKHLQADHIIPFENRPEMRLVLENVATRCNACHNVKTRGEAPGMAKGTPHVR